MQIGKLASNSVPVNQLIPQLDNLPLSKKVNSPGCWTIYSVPWDHSTPNSFVICNEEITGSKEDELIIIHRIFICTLTVVEGGHTRLKEE